MKFTILFILFLLLLSCNNTPPPQVVSRLEEPSQVELDSLKNVSTENKSKNAIALKNSKSLLYVNVGLIGVYLGTIDEIFFKLNLEKIYYDNAEGFVIIGTDKKLIKGKINKLGTEPATTGDLTIYRLIFSESANPTLNGEYVITLLLSAKSNSGEGSWISKNKKQQKVIVIKERGL